MVLMARSVGLPARVAVGFAPGERQEDGTYLVREANAHAWAEVYFPGYGWQIFEATKTINPQFTRARRRSGQRRGRRRSDDPLRDFEFEDIREGAPAPLPSLDLIEGGVDAANPDAPSAAEQARSGNALLIAVLVLGAAAFIWLRFRHLQRRWRLLPAGERAWQRLTLGRRPRRRRAASVRDDLRVRRLAGGTAAAPHRADPHGRRRQGLAGLLGPADGRVSDRRGSRRRGPACGCRSSGSPSGAGCAT